MSRFIWLLREAARQAFADPLRRFELALIFLVLLTAAGTLVYMLLEGWTVSEALYMTVITIATVGYGEVKPLSEAGRMFTIVLILLGVGAAGTAISNAVSIVLGPLLWMTLRQRQLEQMMEQISEHYVVCGYGRMGQQIVRDLNARRQPFIIVDKVEDMAEELLDAQIPHVIGDATRDDVLQRAHIERARGLVAALSSDASNVMTVLTARELNPRIFIVARVVNPESESKLRRAGANRVINPYQIGGHRIALSLLRPAVHDFLDHIFHFGEGLNVEIGQIVITPDAHYNGQTVGNCDLRREFDVNILAIQREDGEIVITPSPQTTLRAGDTLIVIGPPDNIYQLEQQYVAR